MGLEHPQIEARPGVKQPELAAWMSRCAIFALPSRTEAMGRVLIEAGAAAKCAESRLESAAFRQKSSRMGSVRVPRGEEGKRG